MTRRVRFALVALIPAAIGACSDTATNLTLTAPEAARVVGSLPGTVEGLVDVLFKQGNATAARSRWNTVQRFIQRGNMDEARKHMFDLADYTLQRQRQGQLLDPDGGGPATVQQGVTKLLSLMFGATFPGAPPLPEVTNGDAVVTLVDGRAQTAVTPQKKAGIKIGEGSTATPFILVIDEGPLYYATHCQGPLDTRLCQFPLFYRFTPYPYTTLEQPADFGVCSMHNGARGPRDQTQHDRLRLAHNVKEGHTPHGHVIDGVEVMPLVSIGFLDCEGTDYDPPAGEPVGTRSQLIRGVAFALSRLGQGVVSALAPKNAYAIDRGGGGSADFFSSFNVVDTLENVPDFQVSRFALVPAIGLPGEFSAIDAEGRNAGTAAPGEFGYQLIWATDPELTENRQVLFGISTSEPFPPGESLPLFLSFGFVVPEGTAPGTYFVGVVMDHTKSIPESDETNNVRSAPFVVLPPAEGNTFSLRARGTAVMDGVMNAVEWSNAVCKALSFNVPFGDPTTGKVCVMNDAANVYLAATFRHYQQEPGNTLAFEFDNDGTPGSQLGDDIILFTPPNFADDVVHVCESGGEGCRPSDLEVGGTTDGAGAFRFFSSVTVYELKHPLNSGDTRDFVRAPGDVLAFRLFLRLIADGAQYPAGFGDTDWPSDFGELAYIRLAP